MSESDAPLRPVAATEPRALDDQTKLSPAQSLYVWLSGLFVTALILANVTGVKLFRFEIPLPWRDEPLGIEHTAGMLAFPITFVLTDLLNEYYGRRGARRAVYIAFAMGAVAFLLIWAARALPIMEGIPGTATPEAFENVFGAAALMYLASLAAFLIGSLLDILLFAFFKRLTGGRLIWLRATGSTVVSQLFDSVLISIFFFQIAQIMVGQEPATLGQTLRIGLTGYGLKFVIAVALTPLIYLGRWAIRRYAGLTPLPVGR